MSRKNDVNPENDFPYMVVVKNVPNKMAAIYIGNSLCQSSITRISMERKTQFCATARQIMGSVVGFVTLSANLFSRGRTMRVNQVY